MGYRCATCGAWHAERPTAFLAEMPAVARRVPAEEFEGRVELSSDQCIVDGKHFFILGNLDLRVNGSGETIRWTVWSSLSEVSFSRACDLWDQAGRESEPPYFGWLSTFIPGYEDPKGVGLAVHTEPVGSRPRLEVLEGPHRVFAEQRNGITPQRADELIHVACFGSDPT